MFEELGYEVTPEQSLDGLWKTMLKYQQHHGVSDISLEMEGAQYEFRHHLKKYEEYKEKAEDYDRFIEDIKKYYSGVPLDASLHDLVARHYFNKGSDLQ